MLRSTNTNIRNRTDRDYLAPTMYLYRSIRDRAKLTGLAAAIK